jgi:hypothetical protein
MNSRLAAARLMLGTWPVALKNHINLSRVLYRLRTVTLCQHCKVKCDRFKSQLSIKKRYQNNCVWSLLQRKNVKEKLRLESYECHNKLMI